MKKIFAIAAIAALTLTSCVKNEEAFAPVNNEIAFRNFTLTSKALSASDNEIPENGTFSVWAYLTAEPTTAYVTDKPVSYKGTAPNQYWGFTDAIYWPSNGAALDFYAYYPTSAPASIDADSKAITLTDAELGVTKDSQFDYMVSTGATGKTNVRDSNADVTLVFKHLASVVLFKVQDLSTPSLIKIKKIELLDVSTKGTYVQTAAGAAAGIWTPDADTRTASLVAYEDATGLAVTSTLENITTMDAGAVIVVPETFGAQKIKVTYDIAAYGGVDAKLGETKEITLAGMAATHTAWELGKKYTYTIKFGNEITFDPEVTPWEEVGVDVPVIVVD